MARRRHSAPRGHIAYGAPSPSSAISLAVPGYEDLTGAVCAVVAPEVFFPEPDADETAVETARQICAACPVRTACLDRAIRRDERFGVFGGLTTVERDALTGRIGGCGTRTGYWHHLYAEEPACRACRAANAADSAARRAAKKARDAGQERSSLEAAA